MTKKKPDFNQIEKHRKGIEQAIYRLIIAVTEDLGGGSPIYEGDDDIQDVYMRASDHLLRVQIRVDAVLYSPNDLEEDESE